MISLAQLWALAAASLKSQMQYRRSFLLEIAGRLLVTVLELIAIVFLFDRIEDIRGWTRWEVIYLYGMASLSLGLAELLTAGLDELPELVRLGDFDGVLTRPASPLVQVLGRRVRLHHLGRMAQGALAAGVALWQLDVAWTALRAGMLGCTLTCATALFCALFVASAASAFFTVQGGELFNAFTYGGVQMTQYPVPVYRRWLRNLFLFAIPVGFASYFPSLIVLGKPDVLGFPSWMPYLTPVITAAFCGLVAVCWRVGIDHYQSTGS